MPAYRMTVRNAPPGLLLLEDGTLLFKSKYNTNEGAIAGEVEAYVVEGGGRYGGDYGASCVEVTQTCVDEARALFET